MGTIVLPSPSHNTCRTLHLPTHLLPPAAIYRATSHGRSFPATSHNRRNHHMKMVQRGDGWRDEGWRRQRRRNGASLSSALPAGAVVSETHPSASYRPFSWQPDLTMDPVIGAVPVLRWSPSLALSFVQPGPGRRSFQHTVCYRSLLRGLLLVPPSAAVSATGCLPPGLVAPRLSATAIPESAWGNTRCIAGSYLGHDYLPSLRASECCAP